MKICIQCKNNFYSIPNDQKFCSQNCYWSNKVGKVRNGNPVNWKHTKETKEKLYLIHLGKKHLEETKRKMSETHKKIIHTKEWNKNVSLSLKGIKRSNDFKEKCRLRMLGKKPINLVQLAELARTNNNMKRPEVRAKLSGVNSKWWKGGLTPLAKQIRECFEYNDWRKSVFERDNYICQFCGLGGKLIVDHYPASFSEIFYRNKVKSLQEARECGKFWDLNNGRTLCESCHKNTDTYGYKAIVKLKELVI